MSTLITKITTAKTTATLARDYERSTSSSRADVQAIVQYMESVISGGQYSDGVNPPTVSVSVRESATQASGTLTLVSVVATNTCAINGVTFTCVASGAGANQFNVGVSDTATAVNLAASINASVSALVAGYVTATSALGVVTVKSTDYGIYGNQVTLTGSANIAASAARLTGGAVDASAKTYTF